MSAWFTAVDLADLRLPGLPSTKRGVNLQADAEGWADARTMDGKPLARRKAGRGRGFEYHLNVLPGSARAAFLSRQAEAVETSDAKTSKGTDRAALWARFECLGARGKAHARSRLEVLQQVEQLIEGGSTKTAAVTVTAKEHGVSAASIWNWYELVDGADRADWLVWLAPSYKGGGKAKAEISPEAWEVFKADYLRASKPGPTECWNRLQRAAKDRNWVLPGNVKTLVRKMDREVDPYLVVLMRDGPQVLESKYPAQRRTRSYLKALQAINYDGHKLDLFVRWPNGVVGRAMLLAFQDLSSNKILAWRLDTSESAEGFRLAFGDVVENWGLPEMVFSDNTMAAAAKSNTGGSRFRNRYKIKDDDFLGLFPALGVDLRFTRPAHGQSKPIERSFGELARYISKAPECEGAYTGNAPGNKPHNYNSKSIDIEDLLPIIEREVDFYNSRTDRNGMVAKGRSHDDVFFESYTRDLIRKPDPDNEAFRRIWLLAVEGLTCRSPDGAVHLYGNRYWSLELGRRCGQKVAVRYDPDRLHQGVHVYDLDGRYIGEAECIDDTGFTDRDGAKDHAKRLSDFKRAVQAQQDAELSLQAADVAARMPAHVAASVPDARVIRPQRFHGNAAVQIAADPFNDQDRDVFNDDFVRNVLKLKEARDRRGL